MNIFDNINRLTAYGLKSGLIEKQDLIYVKNQILSALSIEGFESPEQVSDIPVVEVSDLEGILKNILDYAVDKKLINGNDTTSRDLFDTRLMSIMTDRPSNIVAKFNKLYKISPMRATEWFYKFSQDTDYIRRYRICRDVKWISKTEYGDMDITINLSKPEKDPKAIAAAKKAKNVGYPSCLLCK